MTQWQSYTVVRAFPGFDVRRYPAAMLAQVRVDGTFARAARRAAGPLHRYLDGHNLAEVAVDAATAVLQERDGASTHVVSVILGITDTGAVPAPSDASVQLSMRPAHEAAALRFTGGWSTTRFTARGRELLANVHSSGLEPLGAVYFARFNPFFTPGVLKRNEALVRVTSA